MILSTKLLNLLGILVIGSISLDVAVAIDDLDDTLKQAIFLVKLLKSDFAQMLRSNDEAIANSTDEENSTCSLPSEEFNSTVAMNETEVTMIAVTPTTPATPQSPSTPGAPPASPNVLQPGAPMMNMMMPYASWPPMPLGYPPPSAPAQQNFPEETYRFPYRINRRRMMPDYYYFDFPAKSRGNFRRFGNDPGDDLGNTPATPQAQTTSSLASATSDATTLHVEETTASTTGLPTTLAELTTSIQPTTEQPILPTTISTKNTILTIADAANQSNPPDPSNQTSLPTAPSAKQAIVTTIEEPNHSSIKLSTLRTKHRKKIGHRKQVSVLKAMTTVISTRNEHHLNVSRHHLRHNTNHTTTTEKGTIGNVEASQFAVELEKELEGTNIEDTLGNYKYVKQEKLKNKIKTKKTTTRTTTTMKVFLQGSSRMPVPFSENNGFCHFHPENALCGAN